MRQTLTEEWLIIPQGVDVKIKNKIVTVKGSRGTIVKNLSHLGVEMRIMDK